METGKNGVASGPSTSKDRLFEAAVGLSKLQEAVKADAAPEENARTLTSYFVKVFGLEPALLIGPGKKLLAVNGERAEPDSTVEQTIRYLLDELDETPPERIVLTFEHELDKGTTYEFGPDGFRPSAAPHPIADAARDWLASIDVQFSWKHGRSIALVPLEDKGRVCGLLVFALPGTEVPTQLGRPLSNVLQKTTPNFRISLGDTEAPPVVEKKKQRPPAWRFLFGFAAALVAMAFIPWPDRAAGIGELNFAENYRISTGYTSGESARVKEVLVRHGQILEPGQVMFQLEDDLLDERIARIEKEYSELPGKIREQRALLVHSRGEHSYGDRVNIQTNLDKLHAVEAKARQELQSLRQAKASLTIRSPLKNARGIITKPKDFSDYTKQSFGNQDFLATVGNMNSDLVIYGYFNEEDLPRILEAVRKHGAKELRVRFFLSEAPDKLYTGTIRDIDAVSEDRNEDGAKEILIRINIDEGQIPYQDDAESGTLLGVSATVYIDCGKSSLLTLLSRHTLREAFWKPLRRFAPW